MNHSIIQHRPPINVFTVENQLDTVSTSSCWLFTVNHLILPHQEWKLAQRKRKSMLCHVQCMSTGVCWWHPKNLHFRWLDNAGNDHNHITTSLTGISLTSGVDAITSIVIANAIAPCMKTTMITITIIIMTIIATIVSATKITIVKRTHELWLHVHS